MPEGSTLQFLFQGSKELEDNIKLISTELEKIGVHGAYKAFKMLRPHSYRSDMYRLMNLWYQGGIYLDAKFGFDMPVEKWIDFDNDQLAYCPDRLSTVNCAPLVMTQYHPIAALGVKTIIDRVENRTYYTDPWKLTGPGLYRDLGNGTGMITQYNARCWLKYLAKMDEYSLVGGEDITKHDDHYA